MAGGPSHLETFDYKPKLAEMHGQPMPESFTKGQPIAQLQGAEAQLLRRRSIEFKKFGKSGQEICELFPHIGTVADDICIIRSMQTEAINHDPAHTFMNTGTTISGRPSMGSWLVLRPGQRERGPARLRRAHLAPGKAARRSRSPRGSGTAAFCPAGSRASSSTPRATRCSTSAIRRGVDARRSSATSSTPSNELNRIDNDSRRRSRNRHAHRQYEMAFRMQTSVPELMDISQRAASTCSTCTARKGADGSFAANCLLARRLAERGVRFIQLYHRDWDHHGSLKNDIAVIAEEVDQAAAALINDLKQRGMLDDTLVIWGGEFGRTPMAQGDGRDHHIKGFSIWLAGGGIKGGITYGATDELGYAAVEDVVHVHDLHATMLHLLGIDHKRLTYHFQGRDFRLTDVSGNVVKKILA